MTDDPIWQAFARTGDPLYYLLYRAARDPERTPPGKTQTASQTAQVRG